MLSTVSQPVTIHYMLPTHTVQDTAKFIAIHWIQWILPNSFRNVKEACTLSFVDENFCFVMLYLFSTKHSCDKTKTITLAVQVRG